MLSSPVWDLAPELQTSEMPEEFMKHLYSSVNDTSFVKFEVLTAVTMKVSVFFGM
jgi:hypothetical protein